MLDHKNSRHKKSDNISLHQQFSYEGMWLEITRHVLYFNVVSGQYLILDFSLSYRHHLSKQPPYPFHSQRGK